MSKTKAWLKAFRLRTLPLSLSGIIMGSFIAYEKDFWNSSIFIFSLITTILFQILSNLANDLGDSLKGTDNAHRLGPTRSVQSGEISKKQMRNAVILFSILSLASSSWLIFIGTTNMGTEMIWFYGILATLCIAAAITYTLGKKAYGYHGFGDIMVFIFFGLVSVLGVYSLYSKQFEWMNILPACSIGLLSTAVLNLNNMRDIQNDRSSGKNTVVVLMGSNYSKLYHSLLITGAFICSFYYMADCTSSSVFIGLIPFVLLFLHVRKVMAVRDPKEFDPELKKVALLTFAHAILTSIGLNL